MKLWNGEYWIGLSRGGKPLLHVLTHERDEGGDCQGHTLVPIEIHDEAARSAWRAHLYFERTAARYKGRPVTPAIDGKHMIELTDDD